MENKRTECVFVHVTPEVKKLVEANKDDQATVESILREFIHSEQNWLKESLKDLESSELIYKVSLVKIKDSFKEAHNAYSDEIEKLHSSAETKNRMLREELLKSVKEIEAIRDTVKSVDKAINSLPILYRLESFERMFNLIDRYNALDERDKDIIKYLIDKK